MDLFKLLGTISINNSEANEALEETSSTAEKTKGKLSGAFSAVGKGAVAVGKTIGTGLLAGGAAMGALTVKALNLSGDLEQNMGGSEAVFKEYATKMQETAKGAFENMGLSTSDFLGTANKMGALFQGAGFTIEESSDLASNAMQRAADVASIMGIDTASAMEAIAGAAKGNFTMMDNLGVAMNDTTLQVYALEKGITKSTQEMTNQEKIGLAMEMFMDKTAYAAGNYAKENETLAGSLGTAKSALTNFLDGSGDVESLVSAFSNAANVIVKNVEELAPRLISGITDIVNQIIPMLPPLLNQLLPVIIEGAISLVNGLVAALPSIIDALMSALPALIDGVKQIINALIDALPSIIESLVSALPTLIPMLVDALVSMVVSICNNFSQIIQPIIDYLPDIIISIVNALLNNLPALIKGIIALIMGIVQAIPQIIQALVEALPTIISMLIQALIENLPLIIAGLVQVVFGIVTALPQIFASLIEGIGNIFVGIWDGIKNIFSGVGNFFKERFTEGKENAAKAWENAKAIFSKIWDGVKNVFGAVGNFFKNRFNEGKENATKAWENTKTIFGGIWDKIKGAFSNVTGFFRDSFTEAWEAVKNVFSGVSSFFTGIFDKIKNAFSSIGTKIADSISGAVKKGINGLIGGAENIINGFFKMINGAIGMINKIPGVNISKIKLVEFTRLAKGGVVDEPTPAVFGEDGAEAVVPLENNTQWLNIVASKLHELGLQYKDGFDSNISIRSIALQQMQISELKMLNNTTNKILNAILTIAESLDRLREDALEGFSIDINKREFARLVKGAN